MSSERKRLLVSVGVSIAATALAVLLIGEAAHFAGFSLAFGVPSSAGSWCARPARSPRTAGFVASYQAMLAELDGGPHLAYSTVIRVVGLSFGAFSVATAIGGLSVDFWALREAGESSRLGECSRHRARDDAVGGAGGRNLRGRDRGPPRSGRRHGSLGGSGGVARGHDAVRGGRLVDQRLRAMRSLHAL